MIYFWKQIAKFTPAFILPIAVGILINIFVYIDNIITFFFFSTTYAMVFFSSMWMFGMNRYEKDLISSPIRKFLRNTISWIK